MLYRSLSLWYPTEVRTIFPWIEARVFIPSYEFWPDVKTRALFKWGCINVMYVYNISRTRTYMCYAEFSCCCFVDFFSLSVAFNLKRNTVGPVALWHSYCHYCCEMHTLCVQHATPPASLTRRVFATRHLLTKLSPVVAGNYLRKLLLYEE